MKENTWEEEAEAWRLENATHRGIAQKLGELLYYHGSEEHKKIAEDCLRSMHDGFINWEEENKFFMNKADELKKYAKEQLKLKTPIESVMDVFKKDGTAMHIIGEDEIEELLTRIYKCDLPFWDNWEDEWVKDEDLETNDCWRDVIGEED